jgi:hypothetical protein
MEIRRGVCRMTSLPASPDIGGSKNINLILHGKAPDMSCSLKNTKEYKKNIPLGPRGELHVSGHWSGSAQVVFILRLSKYSVR